VKGTVNLAMAEVIFDEASHIYPGATSAAVDKLDLQISDGEFLVLVGPSGCGKSTSLRMLAGLEEVDAGRILIGDKDVTHLASKERDIAMVFQNYALYPHMTVAENMGFALKMARVSKAEIQRRVASAAELLDLEPYIERKPKALSGGQRQRVAMGRAIVREPQVFLMDEPLSNLDAKLRVQTRTQIAALQRRLGTTTVYVTHDQVEAMTMGDRVAVLMDGLLQQVGTPRELYDSPTNVMVAAFIGSPAMNLVTAELTEGGALVAGQRVVLDRGVMTSVAAQDLSSVTLGFRPEDLVLTTSDLGIAVNVEVVEELGADAYVYGTLRQPNDDTHQVIIRTGGRTPPKKGETVHVTVSEGRGMAFSPETGVRIS
jgi:multiple sugar transport system ATP-binding protein